MVPRLPTSPPDRGRIRRAWARSRPAPRHHPDSGIGFREPWWTRSAAGVRITIPIVSLGMMRTVLMYRCLGLLLLLLGASTAAAQDHPARRLSNIVGVAVEEYAKAVDARGALVSEIEYQEAVDFLADARTVAARLSGDRAAG